MKRDYENKKVFHWTSWDFWICFAWFVCFSLFAWLRFSGDTEEGWRMHEVRVGNDLNRGGDDMQIIFHFLRRSQLSLDLGFYFEFQIFSRIKPSLFQGKKPQKSKHQIVFTRSHLGTFRSCLLLLVATRSPTVRPRISHAVSGHGVSARHPAESLELQSHYSGRLRKNSFSSLLKSEN